MTVVRAKRPPGIRADGKPRKDLARKAVPLDCKPGATQDDVRRELAGLATSPELAASRVVVAAERKSGLGDSLDVPALLGVLRSQAAAAKCNDLAQAEAMLMNQATALQTLFGRLAERGMGCDTVPGFEANLRIALRAQAQCRATLETLALIKNPAPVAFVRQANIAAGPQQVNNAPPSAEGSRARETDSRQTKLLEAQDGQRLDTGATGAAGEANPNLEAVGAIDRTEDAGG